MGGQELKSWESHEVLEETIRRDTSSVASALRMSFSIVSKWTQSPQTEEDYTHSGARNPLDRIETIISTIEKKDLERAYGPIKWLCARFGFLPPVKSPTGCESDEELLQHLLKWHAEVGETCSALSRSLEDGRITRDEFKRCYREILDDVEAGLTLLAKMRMRVE